MNRSKFLRDCEQKKLSAWYNNNKEDLDEIYYRYIKTSNLNITYHDFIDVAYHASENSDVRIYY